MINRAHRFQGYGSLRFVYQKGRIVRGQFCSLKYILNKRQNTYRAAVVVSRKVHKSAVVRNRIRRRLYEIIRAHADQIIAPYDLVFIVHSEQLALLPSPELRGLISDKLEKAGVLSRQRTLKTAPRAIVKAKEF